VDTDFELCSKELICLVGRVIAIQSLFGEITVGVRPFADVKAEKAETAGDG
jgi:hypothetical protein